MQTEFAAALLAQPASILEAEPGGPLFTILSRPNESQTIGFLSGQIGNQFAQNRTPLGGEVELAALRADSAGFC